MQHENKKNENEIKSKEIIEREIISYFVQVNEYLMFLFL